MKLTCAFDINHNCLPHEFDEVAEIAESNLSVVYWWDDKNVKHAKTTMSVDDAFAIVSRASRKNIPAFAVATIAEGRMVMCVSFCGVLGKYKLHDRYFLGTHGIELYLQRKLYEQEQQSAVRIVSPSKQHVSEQTSTKRPLPPWALAIQTRFPRVCIEADSDYTCFVTEDGYDTRMTYKNEKYVCSFRFRDETYPMKIDGCYTDKWIEQYTFNINELLGDSFIDAVQNLKCEYFAC